MCCLTHELTPQIKNEYTHLAKYMPDVCVGTFYGVLVLVFVIFVKFYVIVQ
jgi:hypothetical protein